MKLPTYVLLLLFMNIWCLYYSNHSRIQASGGAGGSSATYSSCSPSGAGGSGGVGRIKIETNLA